MRYVSMFLIGIGVLIGATQTTLVESTDNNFKCAPVSKADLQMRGGSDNYTGYAGTDCKPIAKSCPDGPKPREFVAPAGAVAGAACANNWCHDTTVASSCKVVNYWYYDAPCAVGTPYSCLQTPGIIVRRTGVGGGTLVCAAEGTPVAAATACGTATTCTN